MDTFVFDRHGTQRIVDVVRQVEAVAAPIAERISRFDDPLVRWFRLEEELKNDGSPAAVRWVYWDLTAADWVNDTYEPITELSQVHDNYGLYWGAKTEIGGAVPQITNVSDDWTEILQVVVNPGAPIYMGSVSAAWPAGTGQTVDWNGTTVENVFDPGVIPAGKSMPAGWCRFYFNRVESRFELLDGECPT